MSEHGMSDKVEVKNIFEPGGGSHGDGMGGLGAMAAIAALGNRNEQGAGAFLPALAAMGHRGHDGMGMGGIGAGLVGGIIGGLLFNRRGGFGGDDGGCSNGGGISAGQAAFDQTILTGITGLTAAVPTVALQTQNAVQSSIGALALGTQQGLANVKDTVQNSSAVELVAISGVKDSVQNTAAALAAALCNVNQNISSQGCQTRELVASSTTAILQRLSQDVIDGLRHERDRAERSIEVNALRSQVEVTQTVNTTQTQAQAQAQVQAQFNELNNHMRRCFDMINVVHQEARSTNSNVIAGNAGAVTTGAQTSTPTNVNA